LIVVTVALWAIMARVFAVHETVMYSSYTGVDILVHTKMNRLSKILHGFSCCPFKILRLQRSILVKSQSVEAVRGIA